MHSSTKQKNSKTIKKEHKENSVTEFDRDTSESNYIELLLIERAKLLEEEANSAKRRANELEEERAAIKNLLNGVIEATETLVHEYVTVASKQGEIDLAIYCARMHDGCIGEDGLCRCNEPGVCLGFCPKSWTNIAHKVLVEKEKREK